MSALRRFWLVRHARPLVAPGVCYGASDLAADPEHTAQSAQALAAALPAGSRLLVSGLQRAQQLALALQALRPDLLPARVDRRLNEMDFGCWELQAWEQIGRAAVDAWTADFAHHRFGGRESVSELLRRVDAALNDSLALGRCGAAGCAGAADAADLVWITHAGVIRAVAHLQSRPGQLPEAADWPREAPGFGQWQTVALRPQS